MKVLDVPAFRRFWYPVAFEEDLATGPMARTVLGEQLVVWSTGDGGAAAAHDKCPHRSSRLSIGWVDDGCVVCPYHGWRFGADGRATLIPQLEPGLPVPPKAQLRTVRCTVHLGVVWVALDDPVGGLPSVPRRANQVDTARTVCHTVSEFVAPFLRVMSITYPTGLNHILVTGVCPVDDDHLRLVQWAVRNDDESQVPAADVVAFDRAVTAVDRWLLEGTDPDYELELSDLAHVKADRGTIALRRMYREFVEGTWPALAASPERVAT